MSDKEHVKNELIQLKKSYKPFKVMSDPGKFPLIFILTFHPNTAMSVDFEGVQIPIALTADYPNDMPKIGNLQSLKTQPLPKGLLKKLTRSLQNQCQKLFDLKQQQKNSSPIIILDLLEWFRKNCAALVMDPLYVESYMAEGLDGSSRRRYAFKVGLMEHSDDSSDDDDDESSDNSDVSSHSHSDNDDADDDDDYDHNDGGIDGANVMESLLNPPPAITLGTVGENDIGLTFDRVDMKGVSVLECHELDIMVACIRCQKQIEVKQVAGSNHFHQNCEACAKDIEVRFFPVAITAPQPKSTLVQQSDDTSDEESKRWAHIELSGCTFFDTLPSCTFRALCFECSAANDIGRLKLRSNNCVQCHNCHKELSIVVTGLSRESLIDIARREPSISKSAGTKATNRTTASKKKGLPKLQGITEGSPLPNNGTCKHYKHSKRWLRFPCCGRAFPCDICHEEQTGDASIFATRMLCGYCSHEQSCKDVCQFCEKRLTGKIRDPSAKKKSFKTRSRKSERVGLTKDKKKNKK